MALAQALATRGSRRAVLALVLAIAAAADGRTASAVPRIGALIPAGSHAAASVARARPRATAAPDSSTAPGVSDRALVGTLDVSALGMGTLNWPLDKRSDPSAAAALAASLRAGVDLVDTAEAYGFGRSEELVKDCLAKAGAVAGGSADTAAGRVVAVASKFAPVPWRRSREDVVAACRASARRLGVASLDLYQIHFPDVLQPLSALGIEEVKNEIYWQGLADCYELGLARNVGVSNYGPKLLARCEAALGARGVPLASNQINYSLLYRKQGAQATVDYCAARGIAVLGYFPLANGLLAGAYGPGRLPAGLKGRSMRKYVEGGLTDRGVTYPAGGAEPLLVEMRRVAGARGKTVAQVALNYVVCKGVIPIPGCRNAKMAEDNAGALGWRLDAGEVAALEAAADALGFEFSGGGFGLVED